jgi:D-3-phosphoglycerate dehydrogenase / 2-oxoglutarate reductase
MKRPMVVVTDTVFPDLGITREILCPLCELVVLEQKGDDHLVPLLRSAVGVINCNVQLTPEHLGQMTKCKVISRTGIGLDTVPVELAKQLFIQVTNVPDYCLDEVADHTFALMLSLRRGIFRAAKATQSGEWSVQAAGPLARLRGQAFGLLGFGRIARSVAARASAFGFKVISHDPFCDAKTFEALGVSPVSYEELLCTSDVLSLHVPLTNANRHMVDAQAIMRMKKGAVLLNTARGGLVDAVAVIDAVKRRHLGGAGLDVLDQEPPAQSQLTHGLDNVLITPHLAFYSEEAMQELQLRSALAVADVLQGKEPANWANRW